MESIPYTCSLADKVCTLSYYVLMKSWILKPEKNIKLKEMGRLSFEDLQDALEKGGFRYVLRSSNYARSKDLNCND